MVTERQRAAARRNLVKARAAKAAKRRYRPHRARKHVSGFPTGKRTLLIHNSLQPGRLVAEQQFKSFGVPISTGRRKKPYVYFTTRQHAAKYGSSKTAVTVAVPRRRIRRDYPEYVKFGALKVKQSDLRGLRIKKWSGKGWRSELK